MKLFLLSGGQIQMKKGVFTPGFNDEETIEIPLPVFLIRHPQGNVLFDTGITPEIASDPQKHWGGMAKVFRPSLLPGQHLLDQLQTLGLSPKDIHYVILSHLHMDHAGNNRFFKHAELIVQHDEMQAAKKPENEGRGYYRRDWDHNLRYRILHGSLDLFTDGRIVLEPLPGHTAGLQIALLEMPNSGKIVLASDASLMAENLEHAIIPKNVHQIEAYLRSRDRLLALRAQGALIVYGHDMRQWNSLKLAPEYYD